MRQIHLTSSDNFPDNYRLLEEAEQEIDYKVVILSGQPDVFCIGMDFQEMNRESVEDEQYTAKWASSYASLLKQISLSSKIIIAKVEGQVAAGGVGLVSACDFVVATPQSRFSLSEVLWGLLPANVLPYLIRRIGYRKAYTMTLTARTLSATEALSCYLVDELNEDPDKIIRRYLSRLTRLEQRTIRDVKTYFRKMWIIDEKMEQNALNELIRLMGEVEVRKNIKNFVEQKKFSWQITND